MSVQEEKSNPNPLPSPTDQAMDANGVDTRSTGSHSDTMVDNDDLQNAFPELIRKRRTTKARTKPRRASKKISIKISSSCSSVQGGKGRLSGSGEGHATEFRTRNRFHLDALGGHHSDMGEEDSEAFFSEPHEDQGERCASTRNISLVAGASQGEPLKFSASNFFVCVTFENLSMNHSDQLTKYVGDPMICSPICV